MLITFCMMCFGVFAARTISYNGTGNISFTGTKDIGMTIKGEYAKNDQTLGSLSFENGSGETKEIATWKAGDKAGESHSSTVQVPELAFSLSTDTYTFTFQITNDMESTGIHVEVGGVVADAAQEYAKAVMYTVADDGTKTEITTTDPVIAAGETLTVQIVFSLKTDNNALFESGLSSTYSVSLNFASAGATA